MKIIDIVYRKQGENKMFTFKKSKDYYEAVEGVRKIFPDTIKVIVMKDTINKGYKVKCLRIQELCGETEVIRESKWIKFKSKKSAIKFANEQYSKF